MAVEATTIDPYTSQGPAVKLNTEVQVGTHRIKRKITERSRGRGGRTKTSQNTFP